MPTTPTDAPAAYDFCERTQMLFGTEAMQRLRTSHVCVFGIGGVGGYATEVLARSGVGELTLIDADDVTLSNLNRQIIALRSTIGRKKTEVMARRIADINPDCIVHVVNKFYLPGQETYIDWEKFDYVADCIDTVAAKIDIARQCSLRHIPLISSMGAANKLDATAFRVCDLFRTKMDPLAKVLRKKLRDAGIGSLKTICSEEPPRPATLVAADGKRIPASNAFVPAAAGLVLGGEIVKDLIASAVPAS